MKSAYSRFAALVVVALSLLLSLGAPAMALAATFTSEFPVATLRTQPTYVAVDAFSAVVLDKRYAQVRVDGVAYPTSLSNIGTVTGHWTATEVFEPAKGVWSIRWIWTPTAADSTRATLYSYPNFATPLADGVHTVTATIRDIAGVSSTDTWTFALGVAPTFAAPTPAAGARVATTTPVISIPVTDNGPGALSATATVNGAPATAVVVGGVARVISPVLANDSTATVIVTVSDASGNAATQKWAFFVESYPEMQSTLGACTECHHDDANHSGMVPGLTWSDCQRCHSVMPHTGAVSDLHTRADVTACAPCHVSDLTVEHARHTTAENGPITCVTCHASSDPKVVSAIARGDSTCSACHAATSGHEALHTTTVTPSCAGADCHTGTSLTSIHINSGTTLTCDSCHASTDPKVVSAIAGGHKECTACHDAAGHAAAHTSSGGSNYIKLHNELSYSPNSEGGVTASCSACHVTSLLALHANYCAGCHSSSAPDAVKAAVASHNTDCTACHPDQHGDSTSFHDLSDSTTYCSPCHPSAPSCSDCHKVLTPQWAPHTASDIKPAYVGGATINLTAVDGASSGSFGIEATNYILDGGQPQIGTQVVVPAPSSGMQTHTLSFWSTDWSGNTEATQGPVTFTVTSPNGPFSLKYAAGSNGTLSGNTSQSVSYNGSGTAVSAVANSGYHFVNWSDGSSANPRTDTLVQSNVNVTANFAVTTYTVNASVSGGNGTISPSGAVVVNSGANQSFTYTPSLGYHVSSLTVDGSAIGFTAAGGTYAFTNVTAGHTIVVTYALTTVTYTINASVSGGNGTISPSGAVVVNSGANQSFTYTPISGYHVSSLTVDGSAVSFTAAGGTYAFTNVTAGHTIVVTYAINTYSLKYAAGSNGTLSGNTSQSVSYNGSGTAVSAVANSGYHFVNWSDGSSANPRTDTLVQANVNVTANFAVTTYTVNASVSGGNGTISPSGAVVVNSGANQSFTYTPSLGYHVSSLTVDGGAVGFTAAGGAYAFTNVTAGHTVVVTYAQDAGGLATIQFDGWDPGFYTSAYTAVVKNTAGDIVASHNLFGYTVGDMSWSVQVPAGQSYTVQAVDGHMDTDGDPITFNGPIVSTGVLAPGATFDYSVSPY